MKTIQMFFTVLALSLPTLTTAGLARIEDPPVYFFKASDGSCIGLPERIDPDEIFIGKECDHIKSTSVLKFSLRLLNYFDEKLGRNIVAKKVHLLISTDDTTGTKELSYTSDTGEWTSWIDFDQKTYLLSTRTVPE